MLEKAKDAYVEHLIAEENFGRNLLEGYIAIEEAHTFLYVFSQMLDCLYHHMVQTARISQNGIMCICLGKKCRVVVV